MIVLLRRQGDRTYYAGPGRWVQKPGWAVVFRGIDEALLLSRREQLRDMEVVIQHSQPTHTVVLPVGEKSWTSEQWLFARQSEEAEKPAEHQRLPVRSLRRAAASTLKMETTLHRAARQRRKRAAALFKKKPRTLRRVRKAA